MRQAEPHSDLQAKTAAKFLGALFRKHGLKERPRLAIVLGSGLGNLADSLPVKFKIPYDSIPHFPIPSIAGHPGSLVLARHRQYWMVGLQGRSHFYEGQSMGTVTFPVRMLGILGIRQLVVTNAAGGVNPRFGPGDFMLISDHISSFIPNPLIGTSWESYGPRFPDMSRCYSPRFRKIAHQCAKHLKLRLREGIYVAVSGPSYETPAEVRVFRRLGGDAIGMSTVPEIMVARQMGLECLGISIITNMAAGLSKMPLSHAEVLSTAEQRESDFFKLLKNVCIEILRLE